MEIHYDAQYEKLDAFFRKNKLQQIMIVCGNSYDRYWISEYFSSLEKRYQTKHILFRDFKPNPEKESVIRGNEIFEQRNCDGLVAVGGGSAIDVAKCIKFLSSKKDIPFIVIPTTAGTGSEATQFAVIYENGEKISVEDSSMLPDQVIFDGRLLWELPDYHKKAALMDAYTHAIESFLSIKATDESEDFARCAIQLIRENHFNYLHGNKSEDINLKMLFAANYAGRAINISKTTAGHAMSYKLSSMYGIPHGQAVSMCMIEIWEHLYNIFVENRRIFDKKIAIRVKKLCRAMQCDTLLEAKEQYMAMYDAMQFPDIFAEEQKDIEMLVKSVNMERMKNYPFRLPERELAMMYGRMLHRVI